MQLNSIDSLSLPSSLLSIGTVYQFLMDCLNKCTVGIVTMSTYDDMAMKRYGFRALLI